MKNESQICFVRRYCNIREKIEILGFHVGIRGSLTTNLAGKDPLNAISSSCTIPNQNIMNRTMNGSAISIEEGNTIVSGTISIAIGFEQRR